MIVSLGRLCCQQQHVVSRANGKGLHLTCGCSVDHASTACCNVVSTLSQLHDYELSHLDIIVCAAELDDGSGLDAIAYIQGIRSDVPIVISGDYADSAVALEAIRAGALDFVVISGHDLRSLPLVIEKCLAHQRIKEENEQLHGALHQSHAELADKNQQLRAVIQQLEAMARTDELTGLCNRRWLNETLERMWKEASRHGTPLSCLMLDLDGFKGINDDRGHHEGDRILKLCARIVEANCRQVDVAARYGGDEFCILMPNTAGHEAAQVAQRMLREFEHAIGVDDDSLARVSMSVGVAQNELSHPVNAEQLVHHADEAMYAAKAAGKRRVMIKTPDGVSPVTTAAWYPTI